MTGFRISRCKCGAYLESPIVSIGTNKSERRTYKCPQSRWWNFWRHTRVVV